MGAYKTICRDCMFKTTEHDSSKPLEIIQIGCSIDKIQEEKAELTTDDGKTYYTLDYICKYCRDEDWAKEQDVEYRNDEAALKIIRKENTIHSDIIILFNVNHTIKDLDLIVGKINNSLIQRVIVSVNNKKVTPHQIFISLSKLNKKWQFIYQTEDTGINKQIEDSFKYVVSPYYIVIEKLSRYNDNLPTLIDFAINELEKKFCMVMGDGFDELIMQSALHKLNHGCYPKEIAEKYKETEWTKMIIDRNQLTSR